MCLNIKYYLSKYSCSEQILVHNKKRMGVTDSEKMTAGRRPDGLIVGSGEYTTGYTGKGGSASDKSFGVVGIVQERNIDFFRKKYVSSSIFFHFRYILISVREERSDRRLVSAVQVEQSSPPSASISRRSHTSILTRPLRISRRAMLSAILSPMKKRYKSFSQVPAQPKKSDAEKFVFSLQRWGAFFRQKRRPALFTFRHFFKSCNVTFFIC